MYSKKPDKNFLANVSAHSLIEKDKTKTGGLKTFAQFWMFLFSFCMSLLYDFYTTIITLDLKKNYFDYNYKLSSKTQISYSNTLAASTFILQDIFTIFSDVKLEVRWYNNCEPK